MMVLMEHTRQFLKFLFICSIVSFAFINQVSGEGRFQIRLLQYVNNEGRGINNHCCDGKYGFCESNGGCDHYLRICVDSFNGGEGMSNCSIGTTKTPTTGSGLLTINFGDNIGGMANPIDIPFTSWLDGGVFLKIEVWDDDYGKNTDDLVDVFKKRMPFNPGSNEEAAEWQNVLLRQRTRLSFNVRAFCDEDWYGESCETYCLAQNSKSGHYTCSQAGEIICLPGWTGHRCSVKIDHCSNGPCRHGTCINSITGYTCQCMLGFTGLDCEENIDDCVGVRCQGDQSSCTDLINGYRCDCPVGRTGSHCESILVACDAAPCLNGATCHPSGLLQDAVTREQIFDEMSYQTTRGLSEDDYTCECAVGWRGRDCNIEMRPCDMNPCASHSTCIETSRFTYKCLCPPGWSGPDCSSNACTSSPCLHDGVCMLATHTDTTSVEPTTLTSDLETIDAKTELDNAEHTWHTLDVTKGIDTTDTTKDTKDITRLDRRVNMPIDQLYQCVCKDGYSGLRCEEEDKELNGLFVPFNDIIADGLSAFVFEIKLRDSQIQNLTDALTRWSVCRDMKNEDLLINDTITECFNNAVRLSASRNITLNHETVPCRGDNRKEVTAYTYRIVVRDEILKAESGDSLLQDFPEHFFPAPILTKQQTDKLECIKPLKPEQAGFYLNNSEYKAQMYMIIGGVSLIVIAVICLATVIAFKVRRRKIVREEVLVPAHNNPLYEADTRGFGRREEQTCLIPPTVEALESNPSTGAADLEGERNGASKSTNGSLIEC